MKSKLVEQIEQGKYPGGKNADGTYQKLIDLFPTHWIYVEPFAGSAALYRRKVPARQSYLIDRDPDVFNHWKKTAPSGTIVECDDAYDWLSSHSDIFTRDWLIYIDPPYPHSTRTKKRIYPFEMSSVQHERLLRLCLTLDANIIISSYDSEMYRTILQWWHSSFPAMTRGGPKEEHVWCNFTPGKESELTRPYAGGNYRERERVKKKMNRHVANFRAMPEWERQALLSALLAAAHDESGGSRGYRQR